ncbi:MAG: L-seryl-tRNA selenium transferase, partial [Spirochaetae bacterium HGW-Spirochaetae-9]
MSGKDYRSELGLPRIINASGTLTSFGGSRVRPEAATAMAEASGNFVDMELLLKRSGEKVAGLLGVD